MLTPPNMSLSFYITLLETCIGVSLQAGDFFFFFPVVYQVGHEIDDNLHPLNLYTIVLVMSVACQCMPHHEVQQYILSV